MTQRKVLVACEFSGVVRDAFIARGHLATSCDLLPSEKPGPHLQCSLFDLDHAQYDLLIAFPPCTHLCVSGARWWKDKKEEQEDAIRFVEKIWALPIKKKALENPIGILSTVFQKPSQIIQPWMFGHGETKATCLWLDGLEKLKPTQVVAGREARVHRMPPGPNRWRERARTFQGIAEAMAEQWGAL